MFKVIVPMIAFALCACTSQAQHFQLALLKTQTTESHLLLEQAVAKLFNGQAIKLANSAFVKKSTVLIERANRSNNGQILQGRVIELPEAITLLSDGQQCYLKLDQQQVVVESLDCFIP